MFIRVLATASVAALLCAAPAMAQEQAEQPIIKQGGNQGGAANTAPKQGNADGGQAMPEQGGNAAAQQESGQGQDQPLMKKGQNAESGQGNAEQQNQNAESDQADTKKQNQNAETEQGGAKKKAADKATTGSDDMTTGSTGKARELTAEKKTVIKEKIVTRNVTRIERSDIDFDISIGVSVPTTIVLNPVPVEIVEVVPEYQGYLFFVMADGTIVIVDPDTHQIVTIIA